MKHVRPARPYVEAHYTAVAVAGYVDSGVIECPDDFLDIVLVDKPGEVDAELLFLAVHVVEAVDMEVGYEVLPHQPRAIVVSIMRRAAAADPSALWASIRASAGSMEWRSSR